MTEDDEIDYAKADSVEQIAEWLMIEVDTELMSIPGCLNYEHAFPRFLAAFREAIAAAHEDAAKIVEKGTTGMSELPMRSDMRAVLQERAAEIRSRSHREVP